MVVVCFVIGRVWCGVAVVVIVAVFSGGWGGGVKRRSWVVVGGVGDRMDVGGRKDGGGWEGKGFVCS